MFPRLALATAFAVGLYLPALGIAPPDSCVLGPGVAGAAPSPSCGGDLRECLRASADMHETTFGGRYVTAEDVSRCVEAFNACAHGGASRGGNQPPPGSPPPQGGATTTSTATESSGGSQGSAGGSQGTAGGGGPHSSGSSEPSRGMPPYRPFTLADSLAYDCTVSGDSVKCSITRRDQLPETMDSWTAEFTGTVSGSTMTGTQITRTQSHYTAVQCIENGEGTEKVSYTFNGDGTVNIRSEGIQWHTSNCSESHDNTTPANDATVPWS